MTQWWYKLVQLQKPGCGSPNIYFCTITLKFLPLFWLVFFRNFDALRDNYCLDVPEADMNDRRLQMWDCHGGNNQKWRNVPVEGSPDLIQILNVNSGKCLHMLDNKQVWQGACDQKGSTWRFLPDGKLQHISGQCLDVDGARQDRGTVLKGEICSPPAQNNAQRFRFN